MALSALYGRTQYLTAAAVGVTARRARANRFAAALSGAALTVSWSIWGYALPIFYILAYLFRALRLVDRGAFHRKAWFLLNLSYINTMALHLALLGAAALVQGLSLRALLACGFWRAMSTAAVLAVDMGEDLVFLRWPGLPAVLEAEAASEEARPFMAFLWFCTGYLLVDSFLCVVELEPVYTPLFLIGSTAVLMYFVVRFLLHIRAIIREEYLKEEHDRLSARLHAAREAAGSLRQLVDRDALTGALSRRYIMGCVNAQIASGAPFCLVYLDLDGLKRVNDSGGHDAGDRYLVGFTRAIAAGLRKGDLLARVGGDEFVILMPGCEADAASRRIGGVREALEIGDAAGAAFRFSYGIAAFDPGEDKSAEALLRDADRAMYRDKERRR